MSSCNSCNRTTDKITAESFKPNLEDFAIKACEEAFAPFKVKGCTQRDNIILEDMEGNAGKYGSCKFHITMVKVKPNGKEKDRGSVDVIVKGLYNNNPDGTLSDFIQKDVTFENINITGRYRWKRIIKDGIAYAAEYIFGEKNLGNSYMGDIEYDEDDEDDED